ncbi:hypothetical protein LCI18_008458 [Fusarium solani-melongenae]|uniref:Uncharacterized protein n=1 Tax=Fusarium solani subsp. cucurbitae TaxID=2747967 RepID=A0ACD3Z8D1_FUSSC|nr:hypothetical protein LCI18_008458 [Fusarium solani-melongenae]
METPFWGPQTSYLNFCEEDYAITRYIAEFINTLSSLAYIAYGLYGLLSFPQLPTGSRLFLYCGLMGVGMCSSGYHMTLKYHTQMSDELCMHLLTTPLVYRLLTFKASPQRTMLIGTVLSSLFTLVMVTHILLDEFILHAVTFASGVLIVASQSPKIVSQHVHDPHIRQSLRNISLFGSGCFAFGYSLWLIDEWACRYLAEARNAVGLPLGFLLELHGWWHILTAIGSYSAVVVVDLVTSEEVLEDPTQHSAWPIPFVARHMAGPVGPLKAKAG